MPKIIKFAEANSETEIATKKKGIEFHKVTTLSKIIAGTIFVILPFLGFLLGYTYGYQLGFVNGTLNTDKNTAPQITPTPESKSTDNIAYDQTKCKFTITEGGYGVENITESDKAIICNQYQLVEGDKYPLDFWLGGKEGKYFSITVGIEELFKIENGKLTLVAGIVSDPLCSSLDGLGVTHLATSCMEESGLSRSPR